MKSLKELKMKKLKINKSNIKFYLHNSQYFVIMTRLNEYSSYLIVIYF